ncbi:MAG: metal-dependent hydrolase [Deltaproteobacteria bacterium]|nr:metal-dependent hydrolase [Deltaproteobacteria bacterium]
MTAPTHVAIGMAASIVLARVNGLPFSALDLLIVVIGSLAPDIDSDDGSIVRPGKILRRFLTKGIADFVDGISKTIASLIKFIFGHRGFFHWPLFGAALYMGGLILELNWLMWFGWAYLWHILADFCTVSGVPFYGPFVTRKVAWSSLRTGSLSERLLALPIWLSVFILGWPLLPEQTRYWLTKFFSMLFPGVSG